MDTNAVTIYNPEDDFASVRKRDITTPRIVLAQPTSPSVMEGICRPGDILADGTKVAGQGEVTTILPILFFLSWVEWNPNLECPKDQRIVARSSDPQSELAKTAEKFVLIKNSMGKTVCKVTEYFNFIVALPMFMNNFTDLYMLSFYRGSHKIGKAFLNRLMRCRHNGNKMNMWMNEWEFMTKLVPGPNNSKYIQPVIGNAKMVDPGHYPTLNSMAGELRAMRATLADRAAEDSDDHTDATDTTAQSEM